MKKPSINYYVHGWQKPPSCRKWKTCFILDHVPTCCGAAQWFPTLVLASAVFQLVLQRRLPLAAATYCPVSHNTCNRGTSMKVRSSNKSWNTATCITSPPKPGEYSGIQACADPLHVLSVAASSESQYHKGHSIPLHKHTSLNARISKFNAMAAAPSLSLIFFWSCDFTKYSSHYEFYHQSGISVKSPAKITTSFNEPRSILCCMRLMWQNDIHIQVNHLVSLEHQWRKTDTFRLIFS